MTAGRPLQIPKSIEEYDFGALAKREKEARTRIRLLALDHVKNGKSARETGKFLCVHENSVKRWIKRFAKRGLSGLKERSGRGAKRKVPQEQEAVFRAAVLELQAHREGGRIRGSDVLTLMKEKLGINCCLDTVYETLKRAKFVWITSRSKHPDSNNESQEDFKKSSRKKYKK